MTHLGAGVSGFTWMTTVCCVARPHAPDAGSCESAGARPKRSRDGASGVERAAVLVDVASGAGADRGAEGVDEHETSIAAPTGPIIARNHGARDIREITAP